MIFENVYDILFNDTKKSNISQFISENLAYVNKTIVSDLLVFEGGQRQYVLQNLV